jgi:hypothetical protein
MSSPESVPRVHADDADLHGRFLAQVLLAKASRHIANKEVEAAAAVYQTFERRGPALRAAAATNLSFLYLLEGDLAAAAKYTDLALKTDRCVGVQSRNLQCRNHLQEHLL